MPLLSSAPVFPSSHFVWSFPVISHLLREHLFPSSCYCRPAQEVCRECEENMEGPWLTLSQMIEVECKTRSLVGKKGISQLQPNDESNTPTVRKSSVLLLLISEWMHPGFWHYRIGRSFHHKKLTTLLATMNDKSIVIIKWRKQTPAPQDHILILSINFL